MQKLRKLVAQITNLHQKNYEKLQVQKHCFRVEVFSFWESKFFVWEVKFFRQAFEFFCESKRFFSNCELVWEPFSENPCRLVSTLSVYLTIHFMITLEVNIGTSWETKNDKKTQTIKYQFHHKSRLLQRWSNDAPSTFIMWEVVTNTTIQLRHGNFLNFCIWAPSDSFDLHKRKFCCRQ